MFSNKLTFKQKLIVKNPVKWFEQQCGEGQIANLLHLEVSIDLLEFGIFMEGLFKFIQDHRMCFYVSGVVVHRGLVEIFQNHITNFSIVTLQMSVTSALPEKVKKRI